MKTRTTLAVLATTAVVLLGASACSGSTGTAGSTVGADAKGSGAASAQTVATLPALSQTALSKAIIATKDLNGQEGARPDGIDGAFIANTTTDVATPADCNPIVEVLDGGGTGRFKSSAYADVHILEADATTENSHHFVHLSAYPGKTAQAFMDAVRTALPKCASFSDTSSGQHMTMSVTPVQLSAGDDAVAFHLLVHQGSDAMSMTDALVRVGSTVATFAEATDSKTDLPPTKQYIIDKQVQKLRVAAAG